MDDYVVTFKRTDGYVVFYGKDGKFTNERSEAALYTYEHAHAIRSFLLFRYDSLKLEECIEIVPVKSIRYEGYRPYMMVEFKKAYSW